MLYVCMYLLNIRIELPSKSNGVIIVWINNEDDIILRVLTFFVRSYNCIILVPFLILSKFVNRFFVLLFEFKSLFQTFYAWFAHFIGQFGTCGILNFRNIWNFFIKNKRNCFYSKNIPNLDAPNHLTYEKFENRPRYFGLKKPRFGLVLNKLGKYTFWMLYFSALNWSNDIVCQTLWKQVRKYRWIN